MPNSQLAAIISKTDKNKGSIGYTTASYASVLKLMKQNEQDISAGKKAATTYDQGTSVIEILKTGLGTFNLEDAKTVGGFYNTTEVKMAAVEICPICSFSFFNKDNVITCGQVLHKDGSDDGITATGKKESVPAYMTKENLNTCKSQNSGDFVIGLGANVSKEFGKKYVENFGEGKLTQQHLITLCSKSFLYGEVFFPVETSGSGTAKVMVGRIVYDTNTDQAQVMGESIFWKCYVPVPVMLLDDFKSDFQVFNGSEQITSPTYNSSAAYRYDKACIEGWSASGLSGQTQDISSVPTTISKWPSCTEEGKTVQGRFRFFIREEDEAEVKSLLKIDIPKTFIGLTDKNIQRKVSQTSVSGSNSTLTENLTGMRANIIFGLEVMNIMELEGKGMNQLEDVHDGAGWTFGWCSLTTKHGNVVRLGQEWAALGGNKSECDILLGSQKDPYSKAVYDVLNKHMNDPLLIKASVEVYKKDFWPKTIEAIQKYQATSALGIATIVRQIVHYPNNIYANHNASDAIQLKNIISSGADGSEKQWVEKYWEGWLNSNKVRNSDYGGKVDTNNLPQPKGYGGWSNEGICWLRSARNGGYEGGWLDLSGYKNPSKPTAGQPTVPFFKQYQGLFDFIG